ncbi:type II secretion system F family protein [Paenalcaligenes niemegkensis]|uniref:type II secretion system F family protein n=1 Tax=Paenalcaligenes niemegkensis TaxID=2895469 RepID=UPI001EE81213|nr:type II secretion system F family protein [Paenalcaligenes niemegkensis]MCQ9616209.1 type II secretion system F family protein [Paenalcaligenes niemegkensis]
MLIIVFFVALVAAVACAAYVIMPVSLSSWFNRKKQLDEQSQKAFETVFLFFDLGSLRSALSAGLGLSYFFLVVTTGNLMLALSAPLSLMLLWPKLLVAVQARRKRSVCKQLPDFIQALALGSRAGLGMQTAFIQLVPRSPMPLRQELELCVKEQQLGISLQQALLNLHKRVPHEGTQLLAASLGMVHRSGGRIGEVLNRLSLSLRAQLHLEAKVRALTAQATLQAWVMAAMPLLIVLALTLLEPELMSPLWTEPSGWGVMVTVLLLEFVGLRTLMKIANIRV